MTKLIIILFAAYGPTIETVEFETRKACESARDQIEADTPSFASYSIRCYEVSK